METYLGPVLDALPAMVWTALPDGCVDFVNRRWSEYTGLSLDESHGWAWQAAINPDDLPTLLERWRSILASGEAGDMEARVRRFDGQYRWFLIQCSPMSDDLGRVTKWCEMCTDVDDFRRAEETLRRHELDFQLIVDSIPIPVVVTTPSGIVEGLNQFTFDYFGKTFEELKGWKASDVVHPDDLERTIAAQLEAHEQGSAYNVESRYRRADGVYRWFNVLGLPLRDPQGHILRWFHLLIEIDDWKRAEEALEISKNNLGLIINTIPVMAWSARSDGSAEFFNQQYLNYVGLSVGKPRNWDWTAAVSEYWDLTAAVHPDDLNGFVATWQAILASGEPGEAEARLRRYDGKYRWFLFRTNPLRDESGKIVQWYGTNTDIDERKRAEEALSASERSSRLIVDSIPGMVAVFMPGGELELVNHQLLEYFGMPEEEHKRWGTGDAVHPEDLPRVIEVFTRAIASGTPFDLELRARRFDGVYRWFQSRGYPLRDTNGRIVRWYNLLIDIDERKRAEEALRQSEARLAAAEHDLRLTIETIPVFVATYRPDGTRSFVNRTWQDYMGLTLEEATGAGATTFPHLHPADIERNDQAWRASLESGEPLSIELRLRRSDGQYRWHTSRRVPLRDEKGDIVRWYSVGIDIEDQKLAEEALRRSEAFLAEGQRLSLTGSFSWRVATDEMKWSQQLYRIFEFDQDKPVTLAQIGARVHPEDIPLFNDIIDRARHALGDLDCEYRLQMPDHSVKYLHVIASGTRDKDGRLEYIGAAQDVTQRRLSEEALAKARSELSHVSRVTSLGAMTASIAHEVNQPLSGIITNAGTCLRMLAADPPNIDGARETARRTIRDGNRAADVITRLRTLFSKRAVAIEPVDLNEAAREVIALLWSDLQRSRVVLRTELADGLPLVGGDRVQLQQVIMNLLRNAADAMSGVDDRPRRLLIRTEPDENNHARLSVRDAGVGFWPEGAERLFEAFYTTKSDGMGIGLSVSRSIIESHNGRLWATSNDGPGATFSFSIPEYSGDETPAQDISAARASGISSAQNIAGIS